jgi:hypothetical protein
MKSIIEMANDSAVRTGRPEQPPARTSAALRLGSIRVLAPMLALTALSASASPARAAAISSIESNFNGTSIAGGDTIWFSSVFAPPSGTVTTPFTIFLKNSTVHITGQGFDQTLNAPNAAITFDPSASQAVTSFNAATNTWNTTLPTSHLSGNALLDGFGFQVPAGGLPGGINSVTWTADFSATKPLSLNWQWGAAVYTRFSADNLALGLKPVDDGSVSIYKISDHAGTPENFKSFVTGGARGGGGSNFTGSYSATGSVDVSVSGSVVTTPEPSNLALAVTVGTLLLGRFLRDRFRARAVAKAEV